MMLQVVSRDLETKVADCRHGRFTYFARDEFVGLSLELYGEYSEGEVELFAKLIKPGQTAIEVGANIGALTVPLAKLVGEGGHVYAFEAQAENFNLLLANTEHHGNIHLAHRALGAAAGRINVPSLASLPNTNFGRVILGAGDLMIEVVTLDCIGLEPAFIKLDVEGMEAEVLRGATETIRKARPLLYVENDRKEKSDELLRTLRDLGYRMWWHMPPLYSPHNFRGNPDNCFGAIVSLNMLAIPNERITDYRAITDELRPVVPPSPRIGKNGWAGICRFGGIGDNLIAASTLRPLKAQGYKIDVISQMPQAVVFENNPFIDKLSIKEPMSIPGSGTDQAMWQNWFRSRADEYDKFANLSHTCEVSLAMLPHMTQAQWPASARRKYYGHNYLEFVCDVMEVPYDFGPLFFPTDEEKDHVAQTRRKIGGGPIVAWCLSGSRVDKVYPQSPIAIARIIKELDAQVIMFGGPPPRADFEMAKQTQEHVANQNGSDRGLHLALSPTPDNELWPIRRALSMVLFCDLVIGPDTGPMWAAAFEPMPKIMLHSHASEANITKHWRNTTSLHADPFAVPCWPCHLLHDGVDSCKREQRRHGLKPSPADKGAACIQSISVEAIIAATAKAIGGRP